MQDLSTTLNPGVPVEAFYIDAAIWRMQIINELGQRMDWVLN